MVLWIDSMTIPVLLKTFRERAPWPEAAVPGVELRGGAGEGDDGREEGQALHRPLHALGVVDSYRGDRN